MQYYVCYTWRYIYFFNSQTYNHILNCYFKMSKYLWGFFCNKAEIQRCWFFTLLFPSYPHTFSSSSSFFIHSSCLDYDKFYAAFLKWMLDAPSGWLTGSQQAPTVFMKWNIFCRQPCRRSKSTEALNKVTMNLWLDRIFTKAAVFFWSNLGTWTRSHFCDGWSGIDSHDSQVTFK